MLDDARQRSKAITWVQGDVMSYEFGRSFDVVMSVATVHHLPELEMALSRLAGLTAPGGVLSMIGLAREPSQGCAASRSGNGAASMVGPSAPVLGPHGPDDAAVV